MSKTLIIFDIDGTLLYSNKVDSQCFATTYERIYQKTFPTIDWQKYPHVTDTTIFDTLIQDHFGRSPKAEEIDVFQDAYVALLEERRVAAPHEFNEIPAACETVRKLSGDDNYLLGIATGGWRRPAMIKLNHIQLPREKMIMSFADGKLTREAIVQEVLDGVAERGEAPGRVVYVGDARWDVRTTRNMKMPFIGIRRKGDLSFLRGLGASHVLPDYQNFEAFMQAVAQAAVPVTITE